MFNKNKLSAAIVALAAGGSSYAVAQENPIVEEVIVTGIRASAQAAMDIKRDSVGVVDAISAEEMGKFPDTNLAESLQRITGVSISRQNGEGAEITVRGFGPQNNMVTLNGRTMPTGTSYAGGSGADASTRAGGSRAFNFANLASDNIAGVEVYKTSKANIATGGIGATVNVKTARPLDNPGLNLTVGGKAVMDTTNRYNDDVTPELSGIVSWTDDDEKFGVALGLSYQERHSASSGITVNNWNIGTWWMGDDGILLQDDLYDQGEQGNAEFVNPPENGQLYARPNDFRYAFSDIQRERLNGQLTLQFRPNDRVTTTLDYTYADNDIVEHRGEVGNWIQNGSNIERVEFDNSAIATPLSITEYYGGGTVDVGYEQQYRAQSNTLDSLGLNIEFAVNDRLTLVFDAHDSTMESLPAGPGNSGEIAFGMGAPSVERKTLDFSGKYPTYSYETDVANDALTEEQVGSSILRLRGSGSVNEITQFKLDGSFEFEDGRFDFGVERRSMEMTAYQTAEDNQTLGDWGINNPGEFAGTGLLYPINVHSEFDDFNIGNSPAIGYRGDAAALAQYAAAELYPNAYVRVSESNAFSDILEEDTLSAYAQVELTGSLAGFETSFLAGVRYETTDVSSSNAADPISHLIWVNNNDFSPGDTGDRLFFSEKSSYDNMLPSLDFGISFTDDITARFSYSKTIARAGYADLRAAPSGFGTTGSQFNGYQATASAGNPSLLPLESDNVDVSLEWYFDETSYASIGFFEKRVSNFIGQGQEIENYYNIKDQTHAQSARVIEAVSELRELGLPTDDTHLFAMIVFQEHRDEAIAERPDLFPDGVLGNNDRAQLDFLGEHPPSADGTSWDIIPEDGDPLMDFLTSKPINNREAKLYGAEFAVQHFFADTGFGVQANYTIVRGDVGFDDLGLPTENQFALTGLSDTANLVLMYEKYGVTARLAYNWRDTFLAETNQGDSRNPRYVDAYSQIDFSVGYDITDQLSVSVEGLNITGEDSYEYNRNKRMIRFADDLGARYQIGLRYTL